MDSSRKIIRSHLGKFCKKQLSVSYEDLIYKMAVNLHGKELTQELYIKIAYDKIGQLIEHKDDPKVLDKILEDIKSGVTGWTSHVYRGESENYKRLLDTSVQKPKAVKGMYKCNKKGCGSDTFYIWSQQVRSADEGMTQFRQCYSCGARGREN